MKEGADNGIELYRLHVGTPGGYSARYEKDLLEGVTVVSFTGKREKDWPKDDLYRPMEEPAFEESPFASFPTTLGQIADGGR